ncbi:MAG: 5-oxoprolinase, partial [Planctomycetes bacterium]|nr:5-oxoprolinase [Planctomycetota bacterium]
MSWHVWIDRGGTFTDVVARDPQGELHVRKLLSEDPERYADAGIEAIRRLLPEAPSAALLEDVRMGTTVATNALLERQGSRVGLLITAGCEDLLEIGTQARPELFALEILKAQPLAERVVGVRERLAADGAVLERLDVAHLRAALGELRAAGIETLAVALLHGATNPVHELQVLEVAAEFGFAHVSLSHRAGGEVGLTARGETTCADAYLTPVLRGYVDRVRGALGADVPLTFMQSNGGLVAAERFQGKDAVLSGPAGGVVACMHVARRAGVPRAIGFDMGGTSTDVCRVDEDGAETVFSREVAGVRLTVPMLNVSTIAAGGGSLLRCDGRRLRVGPESAGSVPGPVCYRRPGGRLALTDANLLLGRIQPQHFPACFGPEGDAPLDPAPARAALAELAREVSQASGRETSAVEVALGCVRIANESMAQAIEEISVARGHDVTGYALVCFGGAGGQHACAVADRLNMQTVVLSPWSGVLSAYGIGLADLLHHQVHPLLQPWEEVEPGALAASWAELEAAGRGALREQGIPAERIDVRRSVELRYRGVDASLEVAWSDDREAVEAAFAAQHRAAYGFDRPGHALELVNLRAVTRGKAALAPPPAPQPA